MKVFEVRRVFADGAIFTELFYDSKDAYEHALEEGIGWMEECEADKPGNEHYHYYVNVKKWYSSGHFMTALSYYDQWDSDIDYDKTQRIEINSKLINGVKPQVVGSTVSNTVVDITCVCKTKLNSFDKECYKCGTKNPGWNGVEPKI